MRSANDPIGPENDAHIERLAIEAMESGGKLICAWGTNGQFMDRDVAVMTMLARLPIEPLCLGETEERFPRHPLYLRSDCQPVSYRGRR